MYNYELYGQKRAAIEYIWASFIYIAETYIDNTYWGCVMLKQRNLEKDGKGEGYIKIESLEQNRRANDRKHLILQC